MDQETFDTRQEREDTRQALTDKIELLEERVRDSVEEAKASVKRKLSLAYHVEQRPVPMLGLSILAGYFIGRTLSSRNSSAARHKAFPRGRADSAATGVSTIKGAAVGVLTSVAVQLLREAVSAAASRLGSYRFGRSDTNGTQPAHAAPREDRPHSAYW